jgi:hypothetical protein
MPIIYAKRNMVIAYEPQPDDVLVDVSLLAPAGDGKHLRPLQLPYEPIINYDAVVEWAVSIADQMAYPIHVLPLNHSDILNTERFEPFRRMLENLTDQERGELRQLAISTCTEVMRDCPDQKLRADCYDMLVQLEVVY